MIKKSLVTAFVMVVAYHFLLPHISHKFFQFLGQQRSNYVLAQRYVYDVPAEKKVIVGSSIAETLNNEALGPGYSKLTLAGGSIFTSLEIIERSGKKPPIILIETNVLEREPDKELLHDLFGPPFYQLRQRSQIFREEGRPANFIGGIAEACVRKTCEWTARILYGPKPPGSSEPEGASPALREKLLRIEHEGWDRKPPPDLLKKQTNQLGYYVDALTRQGVLCILFEMPVGSSLSNLSSPRLWRQAMNERFPPDKYHWLTFDRSRDYQTRDGVHLVHAEAERVTQVVIDYVNRITSQPAGPDSNRQASRGSQ
jgi:hypothetical protein